MQCDWRVAILASLIFVTSCGDSAKVESDELAREQQPADWVLTGGRIFTVDDRNPWAEAVAIADGEFVFVGDETGVEAFVGDTTRTADLAGRLVLPGLIDAHTHPAYVDLEQFGAALPESSPEELLEAVEAYAESHPDDDWIRLCCWPSQFYVRGKEGPHRRDLDAIVPDRPVWITSLPWHSYWLNSKALERLGIEEDTPDPRPGIAMYARDENGKLTGWVKEGAGWQHFTRVFEVDSAVHQEGALAFLDELSVHGVTTVYDAGNFGFEDEVYGFLAQLEKKGELLLRYEGTYQIFVPERRKHAVAEMKRLRRAYGGERLQFNTIKLFMDGVNSNRSGAMLEPFSDNPDYVGATMLSVEELRDFLLELHEERFDLHIHTIGDLAVRRALDAVEAARAAVDGELYPRISLSHLEFVDPADLPRFVKLGVIANFTPWWFGAPAEHMLAAYGEQRFNGAYPARSLSELGAIVTFSSDEWFLGVGSPFLGMEVGHNRQDPMDQAERAEYAGTDPVQGTRQPESERLDLEQLVRGYTIDAAYPFRMEDRIGSIEVGKLADLVVIDEQLFEIDRYRIHEIEPSAVMMEGEVIRGAFP
jgi:predicted amidohydrolase YtcJ